MAMYMIHQQDRLHLEPIPKLLTVGNPVRPDGSAMSKSKSWTVSDSLWEKSLHFDSDQDACARKAASTKEQPRAAGRPPKDFQIGV